jgi:hypothetical protein
MTNNNRRQFLGAAGKVGLGLAAATVVKAQPALPGNNRSLQPKWLLKGTASLCRPSLAPSQLSFRIGLARTRTSSYPLDSMDFIMIDLERPPGCSRHAYWCTGDLTGRLLEFLSCAEQVDGKFDPRLDALFERILKQRRPSGLFSVNFDWSNKPADDDFRAGSGRLFSGLIRYFELTGDARALESAEGLARRLWSFRDAWSKHLKSTSARVDEAWVSEPLARLYAITKDPRWLEFCGMIREHLGTCEAGCHSPFMSTLRGLQVAALVTGDRSWNDKPEQNRRLIIEKRFETPDGCTPEGFPRSLRNEGCSIAEWLLLNLYTGLILDDDAAYDKAERIFWNALAFNQWITGAFGCREMTANGYGVREMQEAWWCCVHHAGMAMSEYARHVATYREGKIRVNFLVPGDYTVPLPGGNEAKVKITTAYPARAEATIEAMGVPVDTKVKLRVPACVRKAEVSESRTAQRVQLVFRGELGHRVERCHPGVILTYGPLVLVPASYGFGSVSLTEADRQAPAGYIPESLMPGVPALKLDRSVDADGFVQLEPGPVPDWSYWDEGPQSRTWVPGAVATVPVQLSNGEVTPLRFTPMCYNTSCLSLYDTPVVLREG